MTASRAGMLHAYCTVTIQSGRYKYVRDKKKMKQKNAIKGPREPEIVFDILPIQAVGRLRKNRARFLQKSHVHKYRTFLRFRNSYKYIFVNLFYF